MSIGERRHRVVFQTATIAQDAFGEPDQTWATLATRWAMVIASAQAVDSSSSDALAISSPVRSITMVWKFRSASSRPCEISG